MNEQAQATINIFLNEVAQGNGSQAALDNTIDRVIALTGSTSDAAVKAIARFVYDVICVAFEG